MEDDPRAEDTALSENTMTADSPGASATTTVRHCHFERPRSHPQQPGQEPAAPLEMGAAVRLRPRGHRTPGQRKRCPWAEPGTRACERPRGCRRLPAARPRPPPKPRQAPHGPQQLLGSPTGLTGTPQPPGVSPPPAAEPVLARHQVPLWSRLREPTLRLRSRRTPPPSRPPSKVIFFQRDQRLGRRTRAPDAARAPPLPPRAEGGGGGREPASASLGPRRRTAAAARARDSPSTAAASDSQHPTPQTPARRWQTWRREQAGASGACASGEAQAPHDPGRTLALRRMRAPHPAPPPRRARPAAGKVPGASDVSAPTRASRNRTAAGRGALGRRGP